MIAILAFGSLVDEPGAELAALVRERRDTVTPFDVEFARLSETRSNAPTLVPVDEGGAPAQAVLFMLDETVSLDEAKSVLWRRETRKATGIYRERQDPGPNAVLIRSYALPGDGVALYVDFPPAGKAQMSAEELADAAIASAHGRNDQRDGLSYLIQVKADGVRTPLMEGYEQEILRRTNTGTLEEAREACSRGADETM